MHIERPHSIDPTRATSMRRTRGFTVVELVTVVMLLAILSVVAISRMVKPQSFAPEITASGVVGAVRLAQQRATSRRDAVVTLTLDRAGDDWRADVSTDVDGVVHTDRFDAANTTITATSGAASAALDAATPLVIVFDAMGDLTSVTIGAAAGAPATGVALSIAGDSSRTVCIYATGLAVEEACA